MTRLLPLIVVLSCKDDGVRKGDGGSKDSAAPPYYELGIEGPAAIDPILAEAPATFALSRHDAAPVVVTVLDADGETVRQLEDGSRWIDQVSWDGLDAGGAPVESGTYTLEASQVDGEEVLASDSVDIEAVRVGVGSGTFTGSDRIALIWHFDGGRFMYWTQDVGEANFSLTAIDDGGEPTLIPAIWADLYAPPGEGVSTNMPAAYPYDSHPQLALQVVATGGDEVALSASIVGWTADASSVTTGQTLTFTKDDALADYVGVIEEPLELVWKSGGDVLGRQSIPVRLYAMLGPPTFATSTAPHLPWVAAVDPALRAIDGVEPSAAAVAGGLVEWIYTGHGLSYDTVSGASSYNEYGRGWLNPTMQLTNYLDRSRGSIVNCSDCAGILNAYANMIGVDMTYAHITEHYLNYILAIGGSEFTNCPFGPGGCGFSYHAVTTTDATDHIFDATLALDGDEDPGSPPSTELLVQEIGGDEYLYRLAASGDPNYYAVSKGTIR